MIKEFFKKITCEHDFQPMTNLYGDFIYMAGGYRSISKCPKCGKQRYSKDLIKRENVPVNKFYL